MCECVGHMTELGAVHWIMREVECTCTLNYSVYSTLNSEMRRVYTELLFWCGVHGIAKSVHGIAATRELRCTKMHKLEEAPPTQTSYTGFLVVKASTKTIQTLQPLFVDCGERKNILKWTSANDGQKSLTTGLNEDKSISASFNEASVWRRESNIGLHGCKV